MTTKKEDINYKWWLDKKMTGSILLIVTVVMQIFAFLEVPVFSTIHGYTFGMLVGFYNPFIYFFLAYISLVMIFGDKIKLPRWMKLTKITYFLVAVSILFVGTSLFHYQNKTGYTSIGTKTWSSFNYWWDDFTDKPWWAPANTNGGIVGAFLYSVFAMMFSGIGALVVAIIALCITGSLLVTGTVFGLYKNMIDRKKVELRQKEIKADNDVLLNNEFIEASNRNETQESGEKELEEKSNSLPFEDPFK